MQLKKIVHVKNIGKFVNHCATGKSDFAKMTLIYGQNGHGKTTLTALLRSLASGNADPLNERKTLGQENPPDVHILLDSGVAKFENDRWSKTDNNIEIYDTEFVSQNVFTGEYVENEHRKNLYQIIVGEAAVKLAKNVDDLDGEARSIASKLSAAEDALTHLYQRPFELNDFLLLSKDSAVEAKIAEKTTKLNAIRKSSELLTRPRLVEITLPELPSMIHAVLATSVEQLSSETEMAVRTHLQTLGHGGESWVRDGVALRGQHDSCPFCCQALGGNLMMEHYVRFFSNHYAEHTVNIARLRAAIEGQLSPSSFAKFERLLMQNLANAQTWSDIAKFSGRIPNTDQVAVAWATAYRLLVDRVTRKAESPALALAVDTELEAALRDFVALSEVVRRYNDAIVEINLLIVQHKRDAASTDADAIERDLRLLRNTEIRWANAAVSQIAVLQELRAQRSRLEEDKKAAKAALSEATNSVFSDYQSKINVLLKSFGATFTIVDARPSYAGGKASSSYAIEINSTKVAVGDSKTPKGTPSFRSALSTGDKSTLALAFFIARMQTDDISNKCVVVDDPLSSFDLFRKARTKDLLLECGRRAAQLIVLSHDDQFLKLLADDSGSTTFASLRLTREGDSHRIMEWKLSDYFQNSAHQEYFLMRAYLDGGPRDNDLVSVARAIRPYLEHHFRNRYPNQMGPKEWLGDFVGKVRNADDKSPLYAFQSKLTDLAGVNDYSKHFAHGANASSAMPDDTELRSWVETAIRLVQG